MPTGSSRWSWEVLRGLDGGQLAAVVGLVQAEAASMGAAMGGEPLSDAAWLALRASKSESASKKEPPTWHGLVWAGTALVAYVQVRAEGSGHVAELAASIGVQATEALAEVLRELRDRVDGQIVLWVRGEEDPAAAVARNLGMRPMRTLLQMRAQLEPVATAVVQTPPPRCPPGFSLRTFEVGADEDAWLAANRAAFVELPDQGGWVRADLDVRMGEPWFRSEGFFLVVTPADKIAGFHWTKIQPGADCGCWRDCGEIYVLGVSPRYQGCGLGGYLTDVGLGYFRRLAIATAMLYVDESNSAAIKTYQRRGFTAFQASRQFVMP